MRLQDSATAERVTLLHHWDTDGMVSAALVVRALRDLGWTGEPTYVCPELGAYEIGDELRARVVATDPDAVFLLDYNVNAADTDALAEACDAPLYLIDHHKPRTPEAAMDRGRIQVLNPVADGGGESDYPSTTYVLERHLGAGPRWLVDMGIVGDLHHRAIPWFDGLEDVSRNLDAVSWDYDMLFNASQLTDAHYKVNDRGAVEAAAAVLSEASTLADVLGNQAWHDELVGVDAEMARLKALDPERVGGALVFRANTHMNLASAITRYLSREHDGTPVFVINDEYYESEDQFYVRNLAPEAVSTAIASACGRGWSAGGKDSVFAAIVPKAEAEGFLGELAELVGGENETNQEVPPA